MAMAGARVETITGPGDTTLMYSAISTITGDSASSIPDAPRMSRPRFHQGYGLSSSVSSSRMGRTGTRAVDPVVDHVVVRRVGGGDEGQRAVLLGGLQIEAVELGGAFGAEEVLQETFLEAYRSLARVRDQGPGSFQRWLLSIAENRLDQSAMADSLDQIARDGARALYDGDLGAAMAADITLINLNLLYVRYGETVDRERHVPLGCLYLTRALEDTTRTAIVDVRCGDGVTMAVLKSLSLPL